MAFEPPPDPSPRFICERCQATAPVDDLERVQGVNICATCYYDVVEEPRKRMSKRLLREVMEAAGPIDTSAKTTYPPVGYSL